MLNAALNCFPLTVNVPVQRQLEVIAVTVRLARRVYVLHRAMVTDDAGHQHWCRLVLGAAVHDAHTLIVPLVGDD